MPTVPRATTRSSKSSKTRSTSRSRQPAPACPGASVATVPASFAFDGESPHGRGPVRDTRPRSIRFGLARVRAGSSRSSLRAPKSTCRTPHRQAPGAAAQLGRLDSRFDGDHELVVTIDHVEHLQSGESDHPVHQPTSPVSTPSSCAGSTSCSSSKSAPVGCISLGSRPTPPDVGPSKPPGTS